MAKKVTKAKATAKRKKKSVARKPAANAQSAKATPRSAKKFFDLPCHFCGGDHHPAHCSTELCEGCGKRAEECKCDEPSRIAAHELYEWIAETLWEFIPKEATKEIEGQVEKDGLLKTVECAFKKYPKLFPWHLERWVKGAKKQPESVQNQYGDCYQYSLITLIGMDQGAGILEAFDPDPDSVRVVHGYPSLTESDGEHKFGHAWIEFSLLGQTFVLDCGTDEYRPELANPTTYYAQGRIQDSECRRYTKDQAMKQLDAKSTWGPWEQPPKDAEIVGWQGVK
jgi:hypothetical protein